MIKLRSSLKTLSRSGLAAMAAAAAFLALGDGANAQMGQSCLRASNAGLPTDQADATYEGGSAQQLMNEISRETASPPSKVGGALVFVGQEKVVVLWLRGEFVCNSGPYERALFERVQRTVFGVDV